MKNHGTDLLEKGKSYQNFGKKAVTWGYSIAVSSFFLVLCCSDFDIEWAFEALVFIDSYTDGATFFAILFDIASLFAFWGPIFYFLGLHYIGLGQIAINTEKLVSSTPANASPATTTAEELPEL